MMANYQVFTQRIKELRAEVGALAIDQDFLNAMKAGQGKDYENLLFEIYALESLWKTIQREVNSGSLSEISEETLKVLLGRCETVASLMKALRKPLCSITVTEGKGK